MSLIYELGIVLILAGSGFLEANEVVYLLFTYIPEVKTIDCITTWQHPWLQCLPRMTWKWKIHLNNFMFSCAFKESKTPLSLFGKGSAHWNWEETHWDGQNGASLWLPFSVKKFQFLSVYNGKSSSLMEAAFISKRYFDNVRDWPDYKRR